MKEKMIQFRVASQLDREQDPGVSVILVGNRTRSRYECPLNWKEQDPGMSIFSTRSRYDQLAKEQYPGMSFLSTGKRTRSRYECPLNLKENKIQL
jgi:hypothetical protein